MKIYVDIDETICSKVDDGNYSEAKPIHENIIKINRLYDAGHEITYWSGRGSGTKLNWKKVTEKQFLEWRVKYHHIILGEKPVFDLLIDDRVININDITEEKLSDIIGK